MQRPGFGAGCHPAADGAGARLCDTPQGTPYGVFAPLVPGAGIYNTAYYFLQDDRALFANAGVETLKIALMLALGIALVCSVPLPQNHSTQK